MTRVACHKFDVLVVGAGPAGMAAAACSGQCGVRVGLVDDNFSPGGQIWRSESAGRPAPEAAGWLERLRAARVEPLCGVRVFDAPDPGVLLAETADDLCELQYDKLILATGARERFLPFPGWTLPNVMGAGGFQALVKNGLPIRGKRVVVAGTGPLLLAVASHLRKHGAELAMVSEQASWGSLARFGVALTAQPAKMVQALQLKRDLAGVRFATGSWPVAAEGNNVLERVTISRRGQSETVACHYLACGFHLVPNTELASLVGCQIESAFVRVDDFQRTSVPEVFCAGEPTGIGGVELALVEGQIAGLVSGGRIAEARNLFAQRKKLRHFAAALDDAFQLRPELRDLPSAETTVCRCEDVPYSRLQAHPTWRAAKLQTRCGMGPCQGRVCGPATQFLFDWTPDSVRPPIFPARVESLAALASSPEPEQPAVTGGH
ncbi:MAG TPA: FAD/NAD(P)-binding oxidoreductase [Terriglobales bacterium]|nr:FAD/NAD(P)-binding oxidoreductase [Terriglobales bacterium]